METVYEVNPVMTALLDQGFKAAVNELGKHGGATSR